MKKVKLAIDNRNIEVPPGTTIFEAAEKSGIFIPSFCKGKEIEPDPSCFVCVVEIEGEPELVTSCSTAVAEGMIVQTDTERVELARRTCIELLLSDHLGDCLGPCMIACPAMIDIPGFINHLANGEDRNALELIKLNMPFPGVLGRICNRPCETACRRQLVEDKIAICHLKRYAADVVSASGDEYIPQRLPLTNKKVAILGAGPAGLTAAYYLQLCGHSCTVFDAHKTPGGMLRYGIPDFRLPPAVIDQEVSVIETLGAEFKYNTRLGRDIDIDALREDFDALFLGLGAQRSLALGVSGEDAEGVFTAIDFLFEHNQSSQKTKPLKGQKVIIIGGGDVAMDTARLAMRKGAGEVHVYCLEQRDEMVAGLREVDDALEEGVQLHNAWGVKEIDVLSGKVKGVVFKQCTAVFDASGAFNPQYNEKQISNDDCDALIIAIGQTVDLYMTDPVVKDRRGLIVVDPDTYQSSLKDVFAAGDCVTGPSNAVEAVAAGRRAAMAIDQYLEGREVVGDPVTFHHAIEGMEAVPKGMLERFQRKAPIEMPKQAPEKRAANLKEVETGFTAEMAQEEAKRCMACGCRASHDCKLRSYAHLFDADPTRFEGQDREYLLDESHPDIQYAAHKCIQCRTCIRLTEEMLGDAAMEIVGRGFTARLRPINDKLVLVDSEGLIRLVRHCPVGALTFKNASVATLNPVFKRPGSE